MSSSESEGSSIVLHNKGEKKEDATYFYVRYIQEWRNLCLSGWQRLLNMKSRYIVSEASSEHDRDYYRQLNSSLIQLSCVVRQKTLSIVVLALTDGKFAGVSAFSNLAAKSTASWWN